LTGKSQRRGRRFSARPKKKKEKEKKEKKNKVLRVTEPEKVDSQN